MSDVYRLIISCPDRVGIVAAVSQFIAHHGGWIAEANHHSDEKSGWFFMRHEIFVDSLPFDVNEFAKQFTPIATQFNMTWAIEDSRKPKSVALLASKESHCISDLLHRFEIGELPCQIKCVISNHENMRDMVGWYKIPFHHVPITSTNKPSAFADIGHLLKEYQIDTVVLAKFMQVLPESLCAQYESNIINIHHSSLPSFMGAKPYHQAFERGVKLIGATCHYVTHELDAGPIIEQNTAKISHKDTLDDMIRIGRDTERTTLARGLRLHLADRVLVHNNKTVIFN